MRRGVRGVGIVTEVVRQKAGGVLGGSRAAVGHQPWAGSGKRMEGAEGESVEECAKSESVI